MNMMFGIALFLSLTGTTTTALNFSRYNVSEHPIFKLSPKIHPVILERYYRSQEGKLSPRDMFFAPAKASYNLTSSGEPLLKQLDVLCVFGKKDGTLPSRRQPFVEVHLHRPSKIFIVLSGNGFQKRDIQFNPRIKGLERFYGFGNARGIVSSNREPIFITDRFRFPLRLPTFAVLLEGHTQGVLRLPLPKILFVNGQRVVSINILFAASQEGIKAHDYPSQPMYVPNYLTGGMKSTADFPVRPNVKCPPWLHDLHVVETRESPKVASKLGDQRYWRTWHPQIDPVYWCYYDHEHGAYPGRHKPMFGYMAWKTYQKDAAVQQRQEESHNGFKVFSFPLHTQHKYVVIVVHMHVAEPRRFVARHHTTTFAVLNDRWDLEMELHMKMDFGPAKATLRNNTSICIGQENNQIMEKMILNKVLAGRRFNILNIDSRFPSSVDTRFRVKCNTLPINCKARRLMDGVYEKWTGPLNTCSLSSGEWNRGFVFDIQDPSTALRFFRDGKLDAQKKQTLNGFSVNRVMNVPDTIRVSKDYCHFNIFKSETVVDLEASRGVFYTDSYFSYIKIGPKKYSVRQFIHPGFQGITIEKGPLAPTDPWNAHLDYKKTNKVSSLKRSYNIERGVKRGQN